VYAATRECLAIEADTSLPGLRVIEVLQRLTDGRRVPRTIVADHGPEFAGRALDLLEHTHGVGLDLIRPNTDTCALNG
jgi:putative transposase